MIQLRDVEFAYPHRGTLFQGLNLQLEQGDRVVLAGQSGSGKSTLLRLIAGLLDPQKGEILVESGSEEPPVIGFIWQQPENQIVSGRVEDEIAFSLEYAGMPRAQMRERVDEALELFDLVEFRNFGPSRLSGGQMQRLAFAATWARKPSIWLLDEPTAYLDPLNRAILHRTVQNLDDDSTIVYSTADPEEYTLFDRLMLVGDQTIVADDRAAYLIESDVLGKCGLLPPREWSLEQLDRNRDFMLPSECFGGGGVRLQEPNEAEREDVDSPGLQESFATLSVADLFAERREFLGESREILHGVNLELCSGEVVALVGPGGAGKSTLIEVLSGLLEPSGGEVHREGFGVVGKANESLHGNIGVAFQFPERSFFSESVFEEVAYGPQNLGLERDAALNLAREALWKVGLDPDLYGDRSPFELSGGEARRVALAAVWALRPKAYLLDEPTAGLARRDALVIGALIREEAKRGCPVLIAGHDLNHFADWADRWVLLRNGVVEQDGSARGWWKDCAEKDLWPAPATVRFWRKSGRNIDDIPGVDYRTVANSLRNRH